jgi:hypothetical protein
MEKYLRGKKWNAPREIVRQPPGIHMQKIEQMLQKK